MAEQKSDLYQLALQALEGVHEQREEILRAFVAKYRCQPDDAVQAMQTTVEGDRHVTRYWVERSKTPDPICEALERIVAADKFIGEAGPEYQQARDAARAALAQPDGPAVSEGREQAAVAGEPSDYRGVLPMIISETGGDNEPECERIICSEISGGADYINNMPRNLVLERITPEGSIFAHYDQTDSPVEGCAINSAPPADGEVAVLSDAELESVARAAEIQNMEEQGGLTASDPNGVQVQLQCQRLAGLRAVEAATITRAAELLQRQSVSAEELIQSYQAGRRDAEADAQQAVEAAENEPAAGEVRELAAHLRRLAPQNPVGISNPTIILAADLLEQQQARIAELEKEVETQRMKVVCCSIVALSDTPFSAAKNRACHPDYWSEAAEDVARKIDELMRLREVLKPVPVSERLPGAGDCDAEGRCWFFDPCVGGWWWLRPALIIDSDPEPLTHWLPAHALPIPTAPPAGQEGGDD